MIQILLLKNGSNLVYCLNNNKIKYKEIAQIYNLSMSRGQISRFLFSSTTLVFLESTLWQETDLISLSAKWPCVQIVLNVRFKQIRIRCGVNRALMCLEIQISIPFPSMENPTAPRAPQCRLPTAPGVCALGWVKCREQISFLIILCIIVYVRNKAHLSLICCIVFVVQIKEKNTHNMRQTTATDDKKSY